MFSYLMLNFFLIIVFFLWLVINSTLINAIYDYFSKKVSFNILLLLNIYFIYMWLIYFNKINIIIIAVVSVVFLTILLTMPDSGSNISIYVHEELVYEEEDEELSNWY